MTNQQIIKDIKESASNLLEWMKAHNKAVDDLLQRVAVLEADSRENVRLIALLLADKR